MDEFEDISGLNRLTLNARRIIINAYQNAKNTKSEYLEPIHVFLELISERNSVISDIFNRVGIDIDQTVRIIKEEIDKKEKAEIENPKFSKDTLKLLNESFVTAGELNNVYVGTEHLFIALFSLPGLSFIDELKNLGITTDTLKQSFLSLNQIPNMNDGDRFDGYLNDMRPELSLQNFSRDMNEESKRGVYPVVTGRDREIKRLIHILSRKTKNNPILVGDAGVGKTAIVEGLVNLLVQKKGPASLYNKKIVSLDLTSILSGARLRGDVEERINMVINEVIEDENTILFIDEIHNIVGAGAAGSKDSMDVANILKPYLTRSGLSIIGATTYDEYTKYFESDTALNRRFQPIVVEEISKESAKGILKNLIPEFEEYHGVKIKEEAVDAAIQLSSKFIQDRYLPDKAIDLLDEAAASIKIGREFAIEPELTSIAQKLADIQKKKEDAIEKKDYEAAAKYKKEEMELEVFSEDVIQGNVKSRGNKAKKIVDDKLIANIVMEWTKIPLAASDISSKKLKNLGSSLKKRIVGQDKVVENVAMAIQRSHLGLGSEKRPLASFLFLGPTGVGKTELAKSLAAELFGSADLLHQVNMSELMEAHSVSKLIGSPPGYVGHQEGGQLTTFIRRKPYSVVLFDEIEKAHSDVLNLLLQILDEGQITDGKGTKVNFKNTVIIMTSNIGAEKISKDSKLGFDVGSSSTQNNELDAAYESMREKTLEELRHALRPELINRIDHIDIFRGLNKEDCLEITKLLVNDLSVNLTSRGIILETGLKLIEHINEEGYSKEYGGRNIRRKIQEILENGLAQFLLDNNIPKNRKELIKISAEYKDSAAIFAFKK